MTTVQTAQALDKFIDDFLPENKKACMHRIIELLMMKGLIPEYKPEFARALATPEILNRLNSPKNNEIKPELFLAQKGNRLSSIRHYGPSITNPFLISTGQLLDIIKEEPQPVRSAISMLFMQKTIYALLGLRIGARSARF